MTVGRIFLLSPARCDGKRAQLVFNERAAFALARRLRTDQGAPLGEVFAFLSGLYFRGKLTFAQAFAKPPQPPEPARRQRAKAPRVASAPRGGIAGVPGVAVITANRGLVPPQTPVTIDDLRGLACVPIDPADPRYREPLERDAKALAEAVGPDCEAVLLGSIATGKYVDALLAAFGDRLRFPAEFVGRGDMSRGGLMLRCVREGRELNYVPVRGAQRSGRRPPKLEPIRRRAARDSDAPIAS